MNPGVCTWSAALHDRIKPRQHILLEPEVRYAPWIKEFMDERPGSQWLPRDGYRWDTYTKLFFPETCGKKEKYPTIDPKYVPPEEGVNPDILFTGNLSMRKGDLLVAQFLNTCALGGWVQKYGRVRFIVWVQDATKVRYLPRAANGRGRATVITEAACRVQEIVSSGEVMTGKGYPKVRVEADANGGLFIEEMPPLPGTIPTGRPPLPEGARKYKKKKEKKENKCIPLTLAECEAALDRVERSRYDIALADEIEREINDQPKSPRGRRKTKVETGTKKARRPAFSPQVLLLRLRLTRLKKVLEERESDPQNLTPRELRRQQDIEKYLTKFFDKPKEGRRWIPEMEYPDWFYRGNTERIGKLATDIMRTGKRSTSVGLSDPAKMLEALERPEEVNPPQVSDEGVKNYKEYEERWGRKDLAVSEWLSADDEIHMLQNKLLQYHQREFDPVIGKAEENYWPAVLPPLLLPPSLILTNYLQTNTALLDFTPTLMDPWFRCEDPAVSSFRWDQFNWLLRLLFTVRAQSISFALSNVLPGGENILEWVDKEQVTIKPTRRVRTLTVKELLEVAKAWDRWPFRGEADHLNEYFEHVEDKGPAAGRPKVRSVARRG